MAEVSIDYEDGDIRVTFSITDPNKERMLEYAIAYMRGLPPPTLPPKEAPPTSEE